MNEEGLKYVDIKEAYQEPNSQEHDTPETKSEKGPRPPQEPIVAAAWGDFEKQLFERMDKLELEEDLTQESSDHEDIVEHDEDDEEIVLTKGSDDESDQASETDSDQEEPVRKVRFADTVQEQKIPSDSHSHIPPASSKKDWIPIRDLVVEHEDVESMDEDDVEEYHFGKEIAQSYVKKRDELLATNRLSVSTVREQATAMQVFLGSIYETRHMYKK